MPSLDIGGGGGGSSRVSGCNPDSKGSSMPRFEKAGHSHTVCYQINGLESSSLQGRQHRRKDGRKGSGRAHTPGHIFFSVDSRAHALSIDWKRNGKKDLAMVCAEGALAVVKLLVGLFVLCAW
jgi:hypothetical protein